MNALVFKWTIHNFKQLYNESQNSLSTIYSENFLSQDEQEKNKFNFSLCLLPKYVDKEHKNLYLSLYLYLNYCETEALNTYFKLSIRDKKNAIVYFQVGKFNFSKENSLGFDKFILTEYLLNQDNGLLMDGNLILCCEILSIEKPNKQPIDIEFSKQISSKFDANIDANEFECIWSVDDFRSYFYPNSKYKLSFIKSKMYSFPGNDQIKFCFIIDFKDKNTNKFKEYISLFLYFESKKTIKTQIHYQIALLDWDKKSFAIGDGQEEIVPENDVCKGCPDFVLLNDLLDPSKGILPEDKLTIHLKVQFYECKPDLIENLEIDNETVCIDNSKQKEIEETIEKLLENKIKLTEFKEYKEKQNNNELIEGTGLEMLLSEKMFSKLDQNLEYNDLKQLFECFDSQFNSGKIENNLTNLMASIEQTQSEYWYKLKNLCLLLKLYENSLSKEIKEKELIYLETILTSCDQEIITHWASIRILELPTNKVKKIIKKVINSFNKRDTTLPLNWICHESFCRMLEKFLQNHELTKNEATINKAFKYIVELFGFCNDSKKISAISNALIHLPLNKIQTWLADLIKSLSSEINSSDMDWNKPQALCIMIAIRFDFISSEVSDEIYNQLFDFVVTLIGQISGENKKALESATFALAKFPPTKVQPSINKLIENLQTQINPSQTWNQHLKFCVVMVQVLGKYADAFKQETSGLMFGSFQNILDRCEDMETVLWAILAIERWCLANELSKTQKEALYTKFRSLSNYSKELGAQNFIQKNFDFFRYQASFCANWIMDNLFNLENESKNKPLALAKLSSNRFSVRHDFTSYFPTVRSSFGVKSGVYFYEVTLLTSGEMRFGWTTRESRLSIQTGIGSDKHSIGLDTSRKCIWHNSRSFEIASESDWHTGAVVGCLIDADKQLFCFYFNGRQIECANKFTFFSAPYYAAASLSAHQHCYFNFGQASFVYPPKTENYKTFYKQSNHDERKFQLLEPMLTNDHFWFKHSLVDNQVDLFYQDEKQKEYDQIIIKWSNLENNIIESTFENSIFPKDTECLRLIQAALEMIEKNITNTFDIFAQAIEKLLHSFAVMPYEKLCELIYPYIMLQGNFQIENTKHRNICIVLSCLVIISKHSKGVGPIRSETITYLTRALTETNDDWTKLFSLIALCNLKLTEEEKIMLQECAILMKLVKKLENIDTTNIADSIYSDKISPLLHQLHFISKHFLTHVLNPAPVPQPNPAALNSHDRTSHLKLSLDLFSARSDYRWQSVRSTGRVTKGIYYFEAVLHTSGPMRIGWSTKRTDLDRTEVGNDEFSVGFDGYNRCVWHEGTSIELKHIQAWKAGDVIGCLIDMPNRQFSFSLNGSPCSLPHTYYFSTLPYHASASLSSFQQCYFNFGQTKFKYPPKRVDYLNFYSFPRLQNEIKDFRIENLNNSLITIDPIVATQNISEIKFISNIEERLRFSGEPSTANASNCYLCKKQTPHSSSRLRFDCCDHLSICHECAPLIRKCPIHK